VVIVTTRQPYLRGKSCRYPLIMCLDEQRYGFGRSGEQKNLLSYDRYRNTILLPASIGPSRIPYPHSYISGVRSKQILGKKKVTSLFTLPNTISTLLHFWVSTQTDIRNKEVNNCLSYNPNQTCSKSNRLLSQLYFKNQGGLSFTKQCSRLSSFTYLLTYLHTYLLHGAESFLRS